MDKHNFNPERKTGDPEQTYNDELAGKGTTFTDTPSESEARDKAKIDKVLSGETQKIDTVHPDESRNDEDDMNEQIRETLEKM